MSSIIYYFSGRGNSFRIANDLSKRLDDTQIKFMGKSPNVSFNTNVDCIGIVTPVIDFGIPAYVKRFVKQLKFEGNKPYVFSVVTYGGMPGASILQLKRCIKGAGLEMNAAFIAKFGLDQYSEQDWNAMLDEMSSVICSRSVRPVGKISLMDKFCTSLLNPLARLMIPREDKKFAVNESCNGCGICTRVCPADNISIVNKRPVWGHKCEQCAACFAWCPTEAVHGTNLAAKTRYINPHVTVKQFLER